MGYDQDLNLMSDTSISDFLEEEGQRLAYVFDPEGKRFFLMELTENVFGRTEKKAIVNRRHGLPPMQSLVEEEEQQEDSTQKQEEIEEGFYGDEGYEEEELDLEGYEIDE